MIIKPKAGQTVYWNDPDKGIRSGWAKIVKVNGPDFIESIDTNRAEFDKHLTFDLTLGNGSQAVVNNHECDTYQPFKHNA